MGSVWHVICFESRFELGTIQILPAAKEPREKHRLEPYFNFGGRNFFNHMPTSPEHFNPKGSDKERVDDPILAEGMANAEKPYRDESIRRAQEAQRGHDYVHSDEYREERRHIENQDTEERLEKHTETKRQQIRERFQRRFGRELGISDEQLDVLVQETRNLVDQRWINEAQRRKEWIEGPIPTGIQKAEDYKRTYLRRAKQEPLSEPEALKEASRVRERAREEAEARLQYGELLKDFQGEMRYLGWEELKRYNDVRNWLNKPLDEHIKAEDYEEALEYVERLKEIPLFNFASWLRAQVELRALELKDQIRKQKEKSE